MGGAKRREGKGYKWVWNRRRVRANAINGWRKERRLSIRRKRKRHEKVGGGGGK